MVRVVTTNMTDRIDRAADALEAEVERRDEWYGLDNWSFLEVVEFVAAALAEGEGDDA